MNFVPLEHCLRLHWFCSKASANILKYIYFLYTVYINSKLILNQNMHTSIKIHILVLPLLVLSHSNIIQNKLSMIFEICTTYSILTQNVSLFCAIFIHKMKLFAKSLSYLCFHIIIIFFPFFLFAFDTRAATLWTIASDIVFKNN